MRLMVELRNPSLHYRAQDGNVEVKDGTFMTQWFTSKGGGVPPGTYEISVSSPLPAFQPASVKKMIGEKGENLSGEGIVSSFGAKLVKQTLTRAIQ